MVLLDRLVLGLLVDRLGLGSRADHEVLLVLVDRWVQQFQDYQLVLKPLQPLESLRTQAVPPGPAVLGLLEAPHRPRLHLLRQVLRYHALQLDPLLRGLLMDLGTPPLHWVQFLP